MSINISFTSSGICNVMARWRSWKKEILIGALQSLKGDFDLKQFLIDKLDTLAGYGNTGLVVLSCKDGHRNTRPSKMATTCSAFLSR